MGSSSGRSKKVVIGIVFIYVVTRTKIERRWDEGMSVIGLTYGKWPRCHATRVILAAERICLLEAGERGDG